LFAAIEIAIWRGPGEADEVAEGVVGIGVGDGAGGVGEVADVAAAVVAVEAGGPGTVDWLALADALKAVGVLASYYAGNCLFHNLRISGRGQVVYQVARRYAIYHLYHAVAGDVVGLMGGVACLVLGAGAVAGRSKLGQTCPTPADAIGSAICGKLAPGDSKTCQSIEKIAGVVSDFDSICPIWLSLFNILKFLCYLNETF